MTTTQVVELASVQPRRCAARPPQRRAASLVVSRPPPGHCRYAPRRRLLLALPQCRCFVLQPRAPPPQRPVRRKGRTHRRAAPRRRFAASQRRVAVRREWPLAHRCHFAAPSHCSSRALRLACARITRRAGLGVHFGEVDASARSTLAELVLPLVVGLAGALTRRAGLSAERRVMRSGPLRRHRCRSVRPETVWSRLALAPSIGRAVRTECRASARRGFGISRWTRARAPRVAAVHGAHTHKET